METGLIFRYDQTGNILYLDKDVIARLNPTSGTVENLEILFFSKRLFSINMMELPILAELRLAS
jgi:hypothetical protein